jgi:YkoY family integral membrane protein
MTVVEILLTIFALIALEGLLSADNAIVLAVMVRPLPRRLQKRALLYGLIGGYVMRALMLLFVTYLAQLWWAQIGGGIYLVYLSIQHVRKSRRAGADAAGAAGADLEDAEEAAVSKTATLSTASRSFWRTVAMVELMDLAFAVDSALVAVALTKTLWVIYIGVGIGILMLRLAAGWFIHILERYPRFEHVAFALVAWAGVKLLIEGEGALCKVLERPELALHLPKPMFWVVTMGILIAGSIWALSPGAVEATPADSADLDESED